MVSPSGINIKSDVVVIAIMKYEEEIKNQLLQMGIQEDRIVMFSLLKDKICNKIKEEMGI